MKNNGLLEDKSTNVFEKCETFKNFLHWPRVRLLCHCADTNNNNAALVNHSVIIRVILLTRLILQDKIWLHNTDISLNTVNKQK